MIYFLILGWKFEKWDGPMKYWMITTGGENERGINAGYLKGPAKHMPNMTTIGVSSVDKFSNTEGNRFGTIEANRDAK
jgi:uncharacterized protein